MTGLPPPSERDRVDAPPPSELDRVELTRTWLTVAPWVAAFLGLVVVGILILT